MRSTLLAAVTETGNARNTVVPNYVTESGVHPEDISGRSMSVNTAIHHSSPPSASRPARRGGHGQREALRFSLGCRSGRKTRPSRDSRTAPPTTGPLDLRAGPHHRQDARVANQHDDAWVDGPGANTSLG